MAGVRRGDPLLFLIAILAGWVMARSVTFSPLWQDAPEGPFQVSSSHVPAPPGPRVGMATSDVLPATMVDPTTFSKAADLARPAADNPPLTASDAHVAAMLSDFSNSLPLNGLAPTQNGLATPQILEFGNRHETALAAQMPARVATGSRWSADGWLLLRRDSATPLLSGRPSYGRSQAGGVIRYRLAPGSPLRPQAYLRASAALAPSTRSGPREQEVATGLSVRPLAGMPLRLAIEARVGVMARGTRLRPAAFAVTEFPPFKLPLGARAEVYAQGGYVGSAYATAFVDGQARIERPVVRRGQTELSAGAGVWGGAQRDASRLDIGPTAAVTFRLGEARGRVAADYRIRVAGDAEPSSGPALTLSAGF